MSHTTTIKPGETITTEPNGAGVRISLKNFIFTIKRELNCNQAISLLFQLEQALEAVWAGGLCAGNEIAIKEGESIRVDAGIARDTFVVRITLKTPIRTIVRDLDRNEAASLVFGLEQALEASACERIRAEVTA